MITIPSAHNYPGGILVQIIGMGLMVNAVRWQMLDYDKSLEDRIGTAISEDGSDSRSVDFILTETIDIVIKEPKK